MPATCYTCGLPFNDSTGAGCCVPCDFLIKAVEPPEELKDMRHPGNGTSVDEESKEAIAAWLYAWSIQKKKQLDQTLNQD